MNIWFEAIAGAGGIDATPNHAVSHAHPRKPRPRKSHRNRAEPGLARRLVTDIGGAVPLRAFQAVRHWRRRGKAYRELNALDNRILKDIGIDRGSIRELVDAQLEAGTS